MNDEYTVQSLSELYLATIHNNVRRSSVQTQTQNILTNLRRRLSQVPTGQDTSTATAAARRRSSAFAQSSPLELLFKPPRFFVSPTSNDTIEESPTDLSQELPTSSSDETPKISRDDAARTESRSSEIYKKFMVKKKKQTSLTKAQMWVFDFLNRPQNPTAILYQIILTFILIVYLFFVIFTDRTTWHQTCKAIDFNKDEVTHNAKGLLEDCLIAHFVVFEWLLRMWASKAQPNYASQSLVKYFFSYHASWSHLLDLLIVIAGSISATCQFPLPLDITQDVYAIIVLRGLHRLFMVAEWTSVQTRHSPLELIIQVFREQGFILFGIFYLQLMLILTLAYVVFHAERHSPDADLEARNLENMLDALYWASITLLTIGYGDKAPKTYIGRATTSFGIIIGMALFSLPAGIIATSLAIKISERDAIEMRSTKRNIAATLIQRFWRFRQRAKRFEMVQLLLKPNPDVEYRKTLRVGKDSKQPKVLNIKPELRDRLLEINTRRYEFYCAQFIELVKIRIIRRRFGDLLKRQQGQSQLANSWQLIKAHWIEHQQLVTLLEKTNDLVLDSVDLAADQRALNRQERFKSKVRSEDIGKMHQQLQELARRLRMQRESLDKALQNAWMNDDRRPSMQL